MPRSRPRFTPAIRGSPEMSGAMQGSGYASPQYAESYADVGRPIELTGAQGWLLSRAIAGTDHRDLASCYPIFDCRKWAAFADDIKALDDSHVSVVLVLSPFSSCNTAQLESVFPDLLKPFKRHYLVNLETYDIATVHFMHRRNARYAAKLVEVEQCAHPEQFGAEWLSLQANLMSRHRVPKSDWLSDTTLLRQLSVPDIVMFRAVENGHTVGIMTWFLSDAAAYYHLAAFSDRGYKTKASFALMDRCISFFRSLGLQKLNLGGNAGITDDPSSGLAVFKKRWANDIGQTLLCGRIINGAVYDSLSSASCTQDGKIFPVYRTKE